MSGRRLILPEYGGGRRSLTKHSQRNCHIPVDHTRSFVQNPYPDRITINQWELLLLYLERCSRRFPGNSWPSVGSRWLLRGVAWQEIGPALCLERATGPRPGLGDRRCDEVGQCLLLLRQWEQDIILGVVAEVLGEAPAKLWAQMRRHYRVPGMNCWGRLIPRVVGRFSKVLRERGIE